MRRTAGDERRTARFLTARIMRRTALRARPHGPVLARTGRRTEFARAACSR
jgi:hypothetical protein